MRFIAVYRRLYFWLGSALVALMDAPPLHATPCYAMLCYATRIGEFMPLCGINRFKP